MAPRTKETITKDAVGVIDAESVTPAPSTALVPTEPAPQALAKPEAKPFSAGRGKEEIDQDDVYLPRMTLAQLTSPQLLDSEPEFIDGLRAGNFFNGVSGEIYGKTIQFAIVKMTKRAGVFDEKGKLVERDLAWNDPRCEWPTNDDGTAVLDDKGQKVKPQADRIFDFLIVRVVDGKPYEALGLSCKRTAWKAGKQLNSIMHTSPGDAWNFVYEVVAIPGKSNGYNYYMPKFARKGPASDEVKAFAAALFEAGVKVRDDEATTDGQRVDDDVPF